MSRIATGLLLTILAVSAPREASALITGGIGNTPLRDPGWPSGRGGDIQSHGPNRLVGGSLPSAAASGIPSAGAT